jgi:hypothetical protein
VAFTFGGFDAGLGLSLAREAFTRACPPLSEAVLSSETVKTGSVAGIGSAAESDSGWAKGARVAKCLLARIFL